MGSSPDDFITVAKDLAKNNSEIYQRCAASRAYYAIYHMCLNLAEEHAFPEPRYCIKIDDSGKEQTYSPSTHENLILRFEEYNGEKLNVIRTQGISYILRQVRTIRSEADYELGDEFGDTKASQVLTSYISLKDKIRDLPS